MHIHIPSPAPPLLPHKTTTIMASMIENDSNEIDEEHRHLVLDGMDEEDDGQVCDGDDHEAEAVNEEKNYNEGDRSMFKMLISDNAAGAIIGKSGKTISELQSQSNARIKVSQAGDFYPGSNERTIVLTGPVDAVLDAQDLIWDKVSLFSKPRRAPPTNEDLAPAMVIGKVLIPNDAGGLIIGRAGATIKSIQEESGARVQINPKEELDSKISKERVLTISGRPHCADYL